MPTDDSTAQLAARYRTLQAELAEVEAQLAAADPSHASSADLSRNLSERKKELQTMYRVSGLADRLDISTTEYVQELVAILPGGWQYVEDACAQVALNGIEVVSPNFRVTRWQLQSPIMVRGRRAGMVTVGYLSPHPDADEGPFLREERNLIDEIAKRMGRFMERKQAEDAQRQLAAIVESSDNAIASKTLDGVVLSWNAAAERMYGYTAREMIGRNIATILTAAQAAEEAQLLEMLRQGYQIDQIETTRRHKAGHDLYIALTISPLHDQAGRIVGASSIARDITSRKLTEATLQESEERLRLTFEQAAVGIAHVGLDGRFLRVNQKLCSIIDYSTTELLEKTFQDITHPNDLESDLEFVRQMIDGAITTYSMEKRYFRKGGAIVWVNLTVSLARDAGGQPKYFISVIEDISKRKQAEQALSESEARFRRLFENSPISLWEQDFSSVRRRLADLRASGVTDFRSFFEVNPDLVADYLADVRMLGLNKASLELYGAESIDDLLVGLDRLVPPEAHQMFIDELAWIGEGRTAFTWEGVNRRLTGERINIRLHWSAAPGYEDTLERVLVSIEDITARRRTEAALQASELRYRTVSELTSDFAFAMRVQPDGNLETEWVTDAFTHITGYRKGELDAYGGWIKLFHPDDEEKVYAMLQALIAGQPAQNILRIRTRAGDTRLLRFHCRPAWDAARQAVTYVYGAGQDITEYRRMEQEIIRTERLTAMGQFSATLAHEIKNPLQAIAGGLDVLGSPKLEPDERDECLRICRDEVRRLMDITHDVLSLSRSGRAVHAPISISDAWRTVADVVETAARQVGAELVVDIPADLPRVNGSVDQLGQLLVNLGLNGAENAAKGGRLEIMARRSGDRVQVTVTDDGPSIPPEYMDHLFEPFFTTKPGGTGLGLYVCHAIVHQHAGVLNAENLPDGGGVRFMAALPVLTETKARATDEQS